MTEKTPINEEYEITAARLLAADGWRPYSQPPQRGLDVRDWIDAVRVLLKHLDAKDDPEADDTDYAHPAWWRGQDNGVAGACMRWEEALTNPMPAAGVMHEPLQSLRLRTEALRTKCDSLAIALGSLIDEATALKTGRVNTIDAALERARKALGQGTEH